MEVNFHICTFTKKVVNFCKCAFTKPTFNKFAFTEGSFIICAYTKANFHKCAYMEPFLEPCNLHFSLALISQVENFMFPALHLHGSNYPWRSSMGATIHGDRIQVESFPLLVHLWDDILNEILCGLS